MLREGTELSRNLRELSVSLRNNAERLLRDVRLAHGGMTARLDQAGPGAGAGEAPRPARPGLEPGATISMCRSSSRRGEWARSGPRRAQMFSLSRSRAHTPPLDTFVWLA